MDVKEKITKARIQLLKEEPFFAYILLNLKIKDVPQELKDEIRTMAVDFRGNLYYNPTFVDNLTLEQLKAVLCHESLHLCLTSDTLVLTSEGLKPIKDIKIGNKVYSHQGYFTEVIGISERDYEGEIYTIKTRFGIPCSFTPEHPILAKQIKDFRKGWGFRKSLENNMSNFNDVRFKAVKDLKKFDSVVFPLPYPNETAKRKRKICVLRSSYKRKTIYLNEEVAYFIGYFVGDGSLHRIKKRGNWLRKPGYSERVISITFHEKEDTTKIENIIRNIFLRKPILIKIKGKKAKRIMFSCYGLAKFLRKHFYDKNGKKRIPTWLLRERKEIIESFLKGLIDSDGYQNDKLIQIASAYNGVYSFLPLILLRLGIYFNFNFDKKRNVATITILKNRKLYYSKIIGNRLFIPIISVEKKYYKGKVYNLETKAHTFCCPFFVTHNCMLHLLRQEDREKNLWNIAIDLVTNSILVKNGFDVPRSMGDMYFYVPSYDDSFTIRFPFGIGELKIENISEKNAEIIYDEIVDFLKNNKMFKQLQKMISEIIDELEKEGQTTMDIHKHGTKKQNDKKKGGGSGKEQFSDDEELSEKEIEELKKKWKKTITEAVQVGRMAGKLPAGIERLLGELIEPKLNWREILYNCITQEIPVDFTWLRPHKKSFSTNIYMPNILREKIEVTVVVDLSGSISDEEVREFFSEVVGIVRTFRNRVSMRIITHDHKVQDDYVFDLATEDEIKQIEIHGGGGTSFHNTVEYINEKGIRPRLVVWLTDGYGDEINTDIPCRIVWVLCKGGSDEICRKYGDVVWLR